MAKKKKVKDQRAGFYIILAVLMGFVLSSAAFLVAQKNSSKIASDDGKNSIQIQVFYPTTYPTSTVILSTPKPKLPECNHNNGRKMNSGCTCRDEVITCKDSACVDGTYLGIHRGCPHIIRGNPLCVPPVATEGDGDYCFAKPVVYLYPEKDTLVGVQVKTEGKIVVSNPLYPKGGPASPGKPASPGGWKNVLAHPDGTLDYQGEQYQELFYESESTTLNAPKKGIIIRKDELEKKLKEYIALLGLTKADEQREFLDWWIPRLKNLNAPYIFFSVLETEEKDRIDHVDILPKPDTFIQFIAYFKPLSSAQNIEPLEISLAPERKGFTAVEWGGVIDEK